VVQWLNISSNFFTTWLWAPAKLFQQIGKNIFTLLPHFPVRSLCFIIFHFCSLFHFQWLEPKHASERANFWSFLLPMHLLWFSAKGLEHAPWLCHR